MPVSCTIVGCGAPKSDNFKNLTFHRFPRNEIKKKKWLNIIGRENIKRNTNRALICSLHFEEKDFNKTLNVVRLRDDVLPSLLLPSSKPGSRNSLLKQIILLESQQKSTSCAAASGLFCMICLDTECRLYTLDKYNLHTNFKNLTGIELKDEVRFVPQLCTECAQRLTNCAKFREKSLRAYHLLAQLGERSEMLTLQRIKTINRKHNRLMSNITKKTFDPDHYDLCVIENNDHVQEIDIKTEDNETNNISNDLDDPLTVFANDFTIKTELNDGLIFENDDNIDLLDDCGTYVTEDNDILLDFDHQYLNYEIKLKKSVLNDENTITELSESVKNETELNDDELPYDELPYDNDMYVFDDCDNYVNFVKSNADMDNSRSKVLSTEVNKNVIKNNNKVSLSNLTLIVNRDKSNIIDGNNKNEIIFKNGSQLNRHATVNSYKINNQIRIKKAFNNNVDNTKNLKNAVKDRTESIKSKKWNCSKNKTIKKYFANDAGLKDVRTDSIEPKNRNCSKKKTIIKDFANYANFKDITKLIKERLERPAQQTAPLCNLKMFEVTEMSKEEQLEEIQRRKDTKKYKICQYKCTICYKGFVDSETFNIHMDKHSDKFGKLECSICRIRTMDKNTLGKHMYSNHRFRYKCLKCSFVTNQKNTALTHELWHDGKQYKCPHCGKIFQKLTTFKNHVRVKHPSDHVCHQCGFSFVGERGLSLHMSRMHRAADTESLDGPQCEECNIRFASSAAYEQHMKVSPKHAPAEKLKRNCPQRKFYIETIKKRTPKMVDCEQCGMQLVGARNYVWHFRKHHPGKNRTKYASVNVLKMRHMCELCGKMMPSPRYHSPCHVNKEKLFKCDVCDKRFDNKYTLVKHTEIHSESRPRHECTVCGKNMSLACNLRRHMLSHKDTRIYYKCYICDKSFTTTQGRNEHVMHIHNNVPRPKRVRAPRSRPKTQTRVKDKLRTTDSEKS